MNEALQHKFGGDVNLDLTYAIFILVRGEQTLIFFSPLQRTEGEFSVGVRKRVVVSEFLQTEQLPFSYIELVCCFCGEVQNRIAVQEMETNNQSLYDSNLLQPLRERDDSSDRDSVSVETTCDDTTVVDQQVGTESWHFSWCHQPGRTFTWQGARDYCTSLGSGFAPVSVDTPTKNAYISAAMSARKSEEL